MQHRSRNLTRFSPVFPRKREWVANPSAHSTLACTNPIADTALPMSERPTLEENLRLVVQHSLQKPPEDMLQACLQLLVEVSRATGGSILGEDGPSLRFLFSNEESLIGRSVPWTSIAGESASRHVVIYTHAPSDTRHFSEISSDLKNPINYLLSVPIPSVHNTNRPDEAAQSSGVLQLLFDENIFPDLDPTHAPCEFSMEDMRTNSLHTQGLNDLAMILPNLSLGMEIMTLRQTSYQAIHELKNKLISARSWINCLKDDLQAQAPDTLTDPDIQEDLELAEDAVTSGSSLAVSYLQFTKIYIPDFQSASLNDPLTTAAKDIETFAREHYGNDTLAIELELEPELPLRQIDPEQLRMAFFNLGKNAVEALHESNTPQPRLTLTSKTDDQGQQLTIADNGPGMPEDIANHLFMAFKTKKSGGTGLGLTISKKIIDTHSGSIRCTTGNTGTCFTIDFR